MGDGDRRREGRPLVRLPGGRSADDVLPARAGREERVLHAGGDEPRHQGDGDPLALAGPVRDVVRQLNASTPVSQVQTMEAVVAASVASRRFSTDAAGRVSRRSRCCWPGIGIYGVIAYDVSQRTYEIGLRMALGAQSTQVAGMMLGRGVRMVALGLVIGVAGSLAVTGVLSRCSWT